MATEVKLPELGDGIESGDVLEIFVSVGDVISAGQDIIEMETDKATVPVPASTGGTVTKILVSEGDTVPIGGAILEVEAAAGSETAAAPAAPAPEASKPKPAAAETAPEPAPAPAPEPEPEPAPAPADPVQQAPQPAATAQPVAATPPAAPASSSAVIAAGPAIRRFAREVGVDLSKVVGSGEHGRITREDVLAVVRSVNQSARSTATAAPAGQTAPAATSSARPGNADVDDFGPIRVERMSKIRKTIARQMHASWSTVSRVTNFDDADISDLERLRQASKEDYAAQGLKLTTMPFLIKAVATALRHHPTINAVIDEENEQVIYKEYVNVGIAVDTDRGLVVPVMQNADRMGIPEITRALAEMAGKVRGGNFGLSDLKGGTFTISNLGAIGGQYSTPIVNIPEVAILLAGRSRKLPVVMPDDSIQPRLMMPLSISYDHRLVDGGTAARFLNDVIGYLEAPSRLLLAL
jgi:pyruvate dehydrogenase E2 component (dihydrolipoamide acetyltransferase)